MTYQNDDSAGGIDSELVRENPIPTKMPSEYSNRAGRRALTALFVVTSLMGVLFIFGYWRNTDLSIACERCVGFVAIMAGIHFVGYRAWKRQCHPMIGREFGPTQQVLPEKWRTPTSIGLLVVGTCFLLLLDGQLFTNSLVFLFCWTTSLVIRLRDPMLPTRTGLHRIWSLSVILLHVILIAWVVLALPNSYAFQSKFNQRTEEMRNASTLLCELKQNPVGSPDAAGWFEGLSLDKKRAYATQIGHIVLEAGKGGEHEEFVVAFGADQSPYPWAFIVGKDRLELCEGNTFEYVHRDDEWVKNQWGVYWVVSQGYNAKVAEGQVVFTKHPRQKGTAGFDVWTPAAGWLYVGPKLPKSERVLRASPAS